MSLHISSSLGMHDQDWPCTADATNELIHHARTAYGLVNGEPNEAYLAAVADDYLHHGAGLKSAKDRMGVMQQVGDDQLAHLEKSSRAVEPMKESSDTEEKRREQAMDVEAAPAPAMSLSAAMGYLQKKGLETGEALDVIAEIPEGQTITEAYLDQVSAEHTETQSKKAAVEMSPAAEKKMIPQTMDEVAEARKQRESIETGLPVEEIEAPAVMEQYEDKMVMPAPPVMSPEPKSIAKEDVQPAIDRLDLIRDYLVEAGIIHDDAMVSRIEEFARTWSHERLHDELMRQAAASFTEERGVLEPVAGYQPEDDIAVLYMAYEMQDKESLFRKYAEQAGPQKKQSILKKWWNGLLGRK